ncbi:hypothetical protein HII31_06754 [Pseudocercospora fuligena]|uniref:Uncharacterized protein n=1 Tax=Pseudocercospora fuligena TaxID=685502 RepID=A0A8H6RJ46_9PEZI|nr:hypothetical protein HII31_06754 [Pseudocercospora fuligena]
MSDNGAAIEESVDSGFTADVTDHAEAYLDYHAHQLGLKKLDVLVVCNLIFHEDKVLLIKLTDAVKSWKDKIGVPLFRLLRQSEDHGLENLLNSRIDKPIDDEISVDEYVRVAARTQVGVDPSRLRASKSATALLTAVQPKDLSDSVWLRASFLWSVEETGNVKKDGYVCSEAWWASEKEIDELGSEDFFMGLKEDLKSAFGLRKRSGSMATRGSAELKRPVGMGGS